MAKLQRALRTFDTSTLSGTPQDIGAEIAFPVRYVSIINPSAVDILISDQSSEDDIRVPANGTLNIGSNLSSFRDQRLDVIFDAKTTLQAEQTTGAGTGTLIINLFG